ncbi:hypothetical protein O181_043931 [Austropuccinia psidii MF-1]|uniref:Uncharacterized protein n=1 Tax=Austropuccinia psidii MF-1 TaxID=1389203 RepID=A0A9Q3DPG4_9BASI|nr:hypothetical protein [Austropuccinia psidii MF-1]
MSSKVLTCSQAHWEEFLSEFHFSITYHPGRLATLPDALLCQDDVYPERGVDFISKNPENFHQVLKQNEIKESRFFPIKVEVFSDLVDQIQKEVWQDKDYKDILKQLARGESVSDFSLNIKPNCYYSKIEWSSQAIMKFNWISYKIFMTHRWLATLVRRRPSSLSDCESKAEQKHDSQIP